jgi:hypothetical protein
LHLSQKYLLAQQEVEVEVVEVVEEQDAWAF